MLHEMRVNLMTELADDRQIKSSYSVGRLKTLSRSSVRMSEKRDSNLSKFIQNYLVKESSEGEWKVLFRPQCGRLGLCRVSMTPSFSAYDNRRVFFMLSFSSYYEPKPVLLYFYVLAAAAATFRKSNGFHAYYIIKVVVSLSISSRSRTMK